MGFWENALQSCFFFVIFTFWSIVALPVLIQWNNDLQDYMKQCFCFSRPDGKSPWTVFQEKVHEWKCELVCVQCVPDGRCKLIVMHSVFTATCSVVSSLGYEAQCRPCLKHLRCGLACEVKQTGLSEIRLDEHDWSQTNNLRWLLVSVALASDTWPD